MTDIMVSVCIISYNHELYIKKCLDSIVSQITNFNFEIIIRDDCSKDNTLMIINEFIKNSDKNVRIILLDASENIGANNNFLATFRASSGKWLALCEGDDYWCDDNKLQKQFDCANQNDDCSFVVHPAYELNAELKKAQWACGSCNKHNINSIIKTKGQFAPTSSYFFKRDILNHLPDWFSSAPVGDYYLEVFATMNGLCYSLSDYMSVYRTNSQGSWSDLMNSDKHGYRVINTYSSQLKHLDKLLQEFPVYTDEINIKKSHALYATAMGYLFSKDYTSFAESISESYTTQWYDRAHYLFYILRKNKFMTTQLFNMKNIVKKIYLWWR